MAPTSRMCKLRIGTTQIRLLAVKSTAGSLSCELIRADLASAPAYRALSYTWGSSASSHLIAISGVSFKIGVNLFEFLRTYQALQESDDCNLLWIDQLCIDQENEQERNWQVQIMAQIYQSAKEVVAWLGPATQHTTKAAWIVDLLESDYKLQHDLPWINRDAGITGSARKFFEDLVSTAPGRKKAVYASPHEHGVTLQGSCKDAIWDLLKRPYWTRLWIVQEIMLARKLTVLWGQSRISRDGLIGITEKLNINYKDEIHTPWNDLGSIMTKAVHREVPLGYADARAVDEELHTVVSTFYRHECKDKRDKIFGLMAIVKRESKVKIDYARSVQDVYLDAVRVMGEGHIRQAQWLRQPVDWESFLRTSCSLGLEMLPDGFGRFAIGPAPDSLWVAKRIGVDPEQFLKTMAEKQRIRFLIKKLRKASA